MASSLRVNSIVPSSGTNVAIGTAGGTISYNASVSGVSTFSSGITIGTGASISSPATNVLVLGTNNSEKVRIDSSGRLGIGTNNPTVALQLNPNAIISNVNYNDSLSSVAGAALTVAQFGYSNSNGSFLRIKATRLSNGSSWNTASTKLVQVTDVTEQGYIEFNPSGGNYGIGFGGYNADTGVISEWVRIDSSGRVTKPYQPAFWITNFSWSTSTQRPHNASNVWSNVGSHFNNSNGIFTAPASGYYLFICTVQGHAPGETSGRNTTYYNLVANKNGSDLGNEIVATCQESNVGKHDQITHQAIINLAANDTFYFRSNYGYRVVQNSYVGYLLG